MKLFWLILILFSTALFGESKIIIAAFSTQEKAQKALNLYKDSLSYKKLLQLQKKDSFQIYTRTSQKYFVIVAEPFQNKKVANEALNTIQTIFPSSRLLKINSSKILEKQHKPTHTRKIDDMVMKNGIYVFITLIIFFTLLYYIRKFKRIYDQY